MLHFSLSLALFPFTFFYFCWSQSSPHVRPKKNNKKFPWNTASFALSPMDPFYVNVSLHHHQQQAAAA